MRCCRFVCRFALGLAALCAWFAAPALAVDSAVEAGAEALSDSGLPWYDAETDQVRPFHVAPPEQPPAPPDVAENLIEEEAPSDGSHEIVVPAGGSAIPLLAVVALGIALTLLLVYFLGVFLGGRAPPPTLDEAVVSREADVSRLEDLPAPLLRSQSDLLGEARRQYQLGDYREAIIYYYSHLLIELDKAQRIRLLRGKTNRQYLGELRDDPQLKDLVGQTMIAFEDVFFGDVELSRERFEACFNRLPEFERRLEAVPV
ncbi:MAG: hypothetical protein KDA41_19505 [Planctomycetales bacterium]|nr:hypothetical protein [Planctomycetales bacterium]